MALIAEWETFRQDGSSLLGRHKLEIIDSEGNISGTFQISYENGFSLIDGAQPKNLWPRIVPRSIRFDMLVRNDQHYQLVRNIGSSSNSNRFIIKYYRDYIVNFIGTILAEGTTLVENAPIIIGVSPFRDAIFTITASDGLTALKDSEFNRSVQTTLSIALGRTTIQDCIRDILLHLPTAQYHTPIVGFQTSWVPDTGTANFVETQSLERGVFALQESKRTTTENNWKFQSNWWALEAICRAFNMRLINTGAIFFFQQLEDINAPVFLNNASFSNPNSTIGTLQTVSITGSTGFGRQLIAPNVTSWSKAYRGSKVTYHFDFTKNLLLGNKFELLRDPGLALQCFTDVSRVPIKIEEGRMRFIGSLEFAIFNVSFSGLFRAFFYLTIKVGNLYWVRELQNPSDPTNWFYKVPEWTTTPGKYYIVYEDWITLPDEDELKFFIPIYFATKYLSTAYDDELLTVCLGFELYDENNTQLFTPSDLEMYVILDDLDVGVLDVENNVVEKTSLDVDLIENEKNSSIIEEEIYFSTGPNSGSLHRITDDQSPPNDTQDWTAPILGTDIHFNLLAKSLIARAKKSNTWMETLLEGHYITTQKLQACGGTWLWWGGTYYHSQHQEYHKGEFLQVAVEASAGSIVENPKYKYIERPPSPTKSYAGPGDVVEIEITGITGSTINADTYNIPMPNTDGWSDDRIRSVVTYNRSGNIQRYKDPPTILNQFAWDNDNRNFVLAENSQSILWHIFRVYK